MIGLNEQCEMCRHLTQDNDGGQKFYDCDVSCILDEDEERECKELYESEICKNCPLTRLV